MTLGGFFSGIGGFELAAEWAGITPVWSNEIDEKACQKLRKNFTHDIIEGDIRDCGAGRKNELSTVDIICGGFPCQPFSLAGKREGSDDNRYLWPEMLRNIEELRPSYVLGENVPGLISMDDGRVFEEILTSLEDLSYTVEPFVIPASAKGAPHQRDRLWIFAYILTPDLANNFSQWGWSEDPAGWDLDRILLEKTGWDQGTIGRQAHYRSTGQIITHCDGQGWGTESVRGELGSIQAPAFAPQGCELSGIFSTAGQWENHWLEVASWLCRVDDGLPAWVDSHRASRIKELGNAIVPHIALDFFKAILLMESFK